ncbi:hypothetical protein AB0M96_37135, partial [Streptomyces sp. NPDC051098]
MADIHPVFCTIVPPHVLDRLARADDPALAGPARRTLEADAAQRTRRCQVGLCGLYALKQSCGECVHVR